MEASSSTAELESLQKRLKQALSYLHAKRWEEAEALLQSIQEQWPQLKEVQHYRAIGLAEQGKYEEALTEFRAYLAVVPDSWSAYNNLGKTLDDLGRPAEALQSITRALKLRPNFHEAYNNLGIALRDLQRPLEAIEAYRKALRLNPNFAQPWNNIGVVLRGLNRPAEAIDAYRRALAIDPKFAMAWNNLALVLKDTGQLDEALASFDKGLAIRSNLADVQGSRLYTLYFHPDYDAPAIYAQSRAWNDRFAWPLAGDMLPHDNDPSPDRRLRVGYVTPDLRKHCHALFLWPLFLHHDHAAFEIFFYSGAALPDAVTARFRPLADQWRDVAKLSDSGLAQLIRQDRIDILVDLPMHLTGNRLRTFARKPAPVQVTWLGFPGTTGVEAIDYRLTDPQMDPPENPEIRNSKFEIRINDQNSNDSNSKESHSQAAPKDPKSLHHSNIGSFEFDSSAAADRIANFSTKEPYYSERSVRLPDTFWCYDPRGMENSPDASMPEVGPLPALTAGHVTFGCLNNFCKVTDPTLAMWARVLAALPDSRLILLCPPGPHRGPVLAKLGAGEERVKFLPVQPRRQYLETYGRIDLCLDTVPYNGQTTTLDALWMGVPVLTRVGRTACGRAGYSQMHCMGLLDLVAWDDAQFVNIAVDWAGDLHRLCALRATLRQRLEASPLMDGARFARAFESAYRQMWRVWCESRS